MVTVMESRGVLTLQQIMEKVNLPVTVTVAANSTRSVKDEFVLRVGMHLKLVSVSSLLFTDSLAHVHKFLLKLPSFIFKCFDYLKYFINIGIQ